MAQPLSLARALVAEDFILANGTLILIKPLADGQSQPTLFTLTVGAAGAASGATSIPLLTPLPDKIYAGTKLKFGTVNVFASIDTNAGATSIPVQELSTALLASAVATDYLMIPVYSSSDSSFQGGETEVKGRNFLSGDYESTRPSYLNWAIPVSGDMIIDDPAVKILKQTWRARRKVYIEAHNPQGQGGDKGTGFITKPTWNRKEDQNITVSFTLKGDGADADIPYAA
jgi:hypothetical protein